MSNYDSMPSTWLGEITVHSDHLVFWVVNGEAHTVLDSGTIRLGAMQAVWIPAGTPIYAQSTVPGTVALPLLIPADHLDAEHDQIVTHDIDQASSDLLTAYYVRWCMPFWERQKTAMNSDRPLPEPKPSHYSGYPPMPHSKHAMRVAQTILQRPQSNESMDTLVRDLGLSSRQLLRVFRTETGFSPGRWRNRVRFALSMRLLSNGLPIEQVAREVGFASAAAFSRAFRREMGIPPGQARTEARHALKQQRTSSQRDLELDEILHWRYSGSTSSTTVSYESTRETTSITASSCTISRVNEFHVMIWMMRGEAEVKLAENIFFLREGEAVWLPAGIRNSVHTRDGAIMVPIGNLPSSLPLRRHHAMPQHLGSGREYEMLYRSSVNYTLLRPYPYDPLNMIALLPADPTPIQARGTATAIAAILSEEAAVHRSLENWAQKFDLDPRVLSRRFRYETGQGYRSWQLERRMTHARALLLAPSATASSVAEQLKYSHPSSFIAAFHRSCRMTPREFQRLYSRATLYDANIED
ncbi:MAG: AraC family transcriptional regulator [Ancrocorticia sp.]